MVSWDGMQVCIISYLYLHKIAPTNYGNKFGSCSSCGFAATAGLSLFNRQRILPGSNSDDIKNWAFTTYAYSDILFDSVTKYLVSLPLFGNRPSINYGNLFAGAQACINPVNSVSKYACISQYDLVWNFLNITTY